MSVGNILIVDDERLTRATLEVQLRDEGFETFAATNGFEALDVMNDHDIDVCLTDLRMPSMGGLELHEIVRDRWPETAVVFMTAFGTIATAVEAMKKGAADYLSKPLNQDELLIRIRRLVQRRREREEIHRLRLRAGVRQVVGDVVARSPAMTQAIERALAVADADVAVLLEGETGTGKQVFAKLIHDSSHRSGGPFVVVNCAELNANLVESELFGHEAGAFTGATRPRRGRFETAFGGTLLIDEADDLPREIQVRLLRFLQDRTFERVGSSRTIHGDVRVLCATKRDLTELVAAGRFREDLFYRINTVSIRIPPLRDRLEDVVPLAEHFLRRAAEERGTAPAPEIEPEAMQALLAHPWPGNVRELEHAMQHALTFSRGDRIGVAHLPPHVVAKRDPSIVALHLAGRTSASYDDVMTECERALVNWALAQSAGNQVQAARLLGMSRTTFRGRLAALRAGGPHACPGAHDDGVTDAGHGEQDD